MDNGYQPKPPTRVICQVGTVAIDEKIVYEDATFPFRLFGSPDAVF